MMDRKNGIVAVLDALGVADYDNEKIEQFVDYRDLVLSLLGDKANAIGVERLGGSIVNFIFNDTVVVTLGQEQVDAWPPQFELFLKLMRKFEADSLVSRILFRGAISFGKFFVDSESNTVMGPAVSDAAAWYDKADWAGILATPRTSILIQSFADADSDQWKSLAVDYKIPMKNGSALALKAVNWPSLFRKPGPYTPGGDAATPKQRFLALLAKHQIPAGTESKFFNMKQFFDHVNPPGA